jgi:sec-independent protein translocase protein TatB
MFDIGWGELVVIGIVALIAIGPKELPSVLRSLGHWVGKIRRMASEFQGQFQEAMREAEIADLKKQFDDASNAAANMTAGIENPLETAQKELQNAIEHKPDVAAESATPPASVDVPVPETPAPVTDSDILPAIKPQPSKSESGAA